MSVGIGPLQIWMVSLAFKYQMQELRMEAQGAIQAWVRIGLIAPFTLVVDPLAGADGAWRQTSCHLTHFRGDQQRQGQRAALSKVTTASASFACCLSFTF